MKEQNLFLCWCSRMRFAIFLMSFLWGFAGMRNLNAQEGETLLKANNDTRFVMPGKTLYYNVLNNDELGICKYNTLQSFQIIQNVKHGIAAINPLTKIITYIPAAGYMGQDSLIYRIECSGIVSTATAYINVNNQPDDVFTDVCTVTPPVTVWDIEKKAQTSSAYYVQAYAQPFVGDLDRDGRPEIVAVSKSTIVTSPTLSNFVYVFNDDLSLKYRFSVPMMDVYVVSPLVIADVDNDGQGEIVIATNIDDGQKLRCYTVDGTLKWVSDQSYFSPSKPAGNHGVSLIIGDIDNDGNPELFAGDRVFAAESGKLLVTLPDGPRGCRTDFNTGTDRYGYMPVMADFDNDGNLEIAAGNTVYKINDISNRDGTAAGNTASILKQCTVVPAGRTDGYTSTADIDGDGYLDVVVVNYYNNSYPTLMYAWSPKKGILFASVSPPAQPNPSGITGAAPIYGSRAFIGDINGDGQNEICFTYYCGIIAYAYDETTGTFTRLWVKTTTDTSGSTTMSMFDFNLDGEQELVYRDEDYLRIIDKNGNNLTTVECRSGTHTEYPVVVDLDNDGHADIVVSGSLNPANPNATISNDSIANGTMRIMHFGSITPGMWADARNVWNQHGYNPVYINEDLTVPQYAINPTTAFYDKDSPKINYPFNNFLQQSTNLNEEGEALFLGPDLLFDNTVRKTLKVVGNDMNVTIGVTNEGNATYSGNLRISTYVYDKTTMTYTKLGPGADVTVSIPVGTTQTITYQILNYINYLPANYDNWEIRLNWEDDTYPIDQEECLYSNNIAGDFSMTQGECVICEGKTGRVYLEPQSTYYYEWYNASTGGTRVGSGDYMEVTKDATPVQYYFIDVYNDASKSKLLNPARDTAFVFRAPDSLVWIGHVDGDWHKYENWLNPNDPANLYERANIPRKCTDVLIPDGISVYPDLTPVTLGGGTDYSYYPASECANITFEHGGEVMRTDSLDYDAAYVHLTLNSNRWYMLSVPLQGMFPGDYYVKDPRPCEDDVFVYTRLFNRTNPETGKFIAGAWTGVFNNPDYPMPAGSGFSVWADDKQPLLTVHDPYDFFFPKYDASYNVYDRTDPCSVRYNVPITRVNPNRFVYEPVLNGSSGNITLDVSADAAGRLVIAGNPFMAHWNFEDFYNMNSSAIFPYYQVLDENGNFISFYLNSSDGTTTGGLTKYIAPMQSVLLTARTSFSNLTANAKMTVTDAGDKLRSTAQTPPEPLYIRILKDGRTNRSVLLLPTGQGEETNVPKIFLNNADDPATVYTLDADGNYLDQQYAGDFSSPLFLGIRTKSTGAFELRFDGTRTFAPDYDLYLTDLQSETPEQINLRVFPYYRFEKTTDDLFVPDRFYLSFIRKETKISSPEAVPTTGMEAYSSDGILHVLSVDGSLLKEVTVFDLQGRAVQTRKNINDYRIDIPAERNRIYLIRSVNGNTSRTMKVCGR